MPRAFHAQSHNALRSTQGPVHFQEDATAAPGDEGTFPRSHDQGRSPTASATCSEPGLSSRWTPSPSATRAFRSSFSLCFLPCNHPLPPRLIDVQCLTHGIRTCQMTGIELRELLFSQAEVNWNVFREEESAGEDESG